MELRLANMTDLPKVQEMYRAVVKNMIQNKIYVWDEVYSVDFLSDDIKKSNFYILEQGDVIISAFALNTSREGEFFVKFDSGPEKALYLDRFCVNANFLRKGIAEFTINEAIELSRKLGAKYLRLFAADNNMPAINLYLKTGFKKAYGVYEEKIDDETILYEIGFEIKID